MEEDIVCAAKSASLQVFLFAGLILRTIRCNSIKLSSSFYRFLARYSGRRRRPVWRFLGGGLSMPPPLATFLLVVTALLRVADACSSRSTPRPRPPTPTPRPNITFHTYACPPAYATWYCLNGATCFTVKIGESLLYNCECSDGYMGQRCEFKDLEGSYIPTRQRVMLETASIAGGATIAVLLVVIVCIAVYMHYSRRQKERSISSSDRVDFGDLERRPFSKRSWEKPVAAVVTLDASGEAPPPTVRLFRPPP